MRFRFDEDQVAMRDAVRAFCASRLDLADVAGREGKPADPALWAAMADLGVLGLLVDEPGSGIGIVDAALVFEELAAHLVTGPVLWSTLASPFVEDVAGGDVRVAGVEIDGQSDGPVVVEHADECDVLLVLRRDGVERCARSELEPRRPMRDESPSGSRRGSASEGLRGELPPSVDGSALDPLTPAAVFQSIPSGQVVGGADAAQKLRRSGEILSAAMLVGVAQGALDVARGYALEREQFGVPIGSFQAIKHLLADMYVRVELARAAMYAAAAIAAATPADGRAGDPDRAAGTAKLLAGEAGITNGRAAVQILGGMGFSWEMLPHYFPKRAWVLEHGFGTAPSHAARIGAAVGEEVGP